MLINALICYNKTKRLYRTKRLEYFVPQYTRAELLDEIEQSITRLRDAIACDYIDGADFYARKIQGLVSRL